MKRKAMGGAQLGLKYLYLVGSIWISSGARWRKGKTQAARE